MRYVEIRRHTDNDDDRLSAEGKQAAEEIGRSGLNPPYDVFVSTGAQRATEMLTILRRAAGQEDAAITEQTALRSPVEDRWKEAAKAAGKGADLEAMRKVDPDLVEKETTQLATALRQVLDGLPDSGRALVVGHTPTNEAAVLGLTGTLMQPLDKGAGVLITEDDGSFSVEPLSG